MTEINRAEVVRLYNEHYSTTQIAEKFGTYANKITRILKKEGVALRSAKEAHKVAVEKGRYKHPTAGKGHSEETKEKIGDKLMNAWKYRERPALKTQIARHRDKAVKANLKASKEGSSIELYLNKELLGRGEDVRFHQKNFVLGEKLEMDLLLPQRNLVIEVDGITHHKPVYGETEQDKLEKFEKKKESDNKKNSLLIDAGYNVLRIKVTVNANKARLRQMLRNVINYLENPPEEICVTYIDF